MNRNKKREQRIRKMIIACALAAVVLTASTFAWFIGMQTVNVASFDVNIAAIDGLSLSLNGATWSDTVYIDSDTYSTNSYTGNTNSWGGSGLVPVSSVGDIDSNVSRLILFEKGSLTTTPGGYRIMASRVNNYREVSGALEAEANGYVVFDLFIKNLSGAEYYPALNKLNEEAIFLTTDSAVTSATNGGVAGTGIENSVRVAFAQIGRVKATTTTVGTITGISCTDTTDGGKDAEGVTGICSRTAQIWEPNDVKHVANAVNWYKTSCKKRTGADLTLATSYNGSCGLVKDGTANKTYAVSGVIDYTNQVDVYDGTEYNGYTESINTVTTAADGSIAATNSEAGKLVAYPYFTDTMKNLEGTARPTFITLAPNSITKVRIYIYIEGQDIDNYDFASLGRKITVGFGFTKERFVDTDVNYDDTNTATLPDDVRRETNPIEQYTPNPAATSATVGD